MFLAFIIDDDVASTEATELMFPWDDINVSSVIKICDPCNISERILNEKPDIVFIDIEMGSVSGLDIIKECKDQNSESFFIIISGHDNFNYAHAAVNLGAIHYLLKPIDYDDVDIVIKKLKKLLPQKNTFPKTNDLNQNEKNIDLWNKIKNYIDDNYMHKILAVDICNKFFIGTTLLYSLFKANSGKTFIDYLTNYRLEKAKWLLKNTDEPLYKIAEMVGISDHYYLDTLFKKHFNISLNNYRIQNRGGEENS